MGKLRIRYLHLGYDTQKGLGFSVERLRDSQFYNFTAGTFMGVVADQDAVKPLQPRTQTRYQHFWVTDLTLDPTQFTDGDYAVTVHSLDDYAPLSPPIAAYVFRGDDMSPGPITNLSGVFDLSLS